MRRVLVLVIMLTLAAAASVAAEGAVFEKFLSADDPADRAILAYLDREKHGSASSLDLTELGVLLVGKGFPEDAEDYFEKALKADKTNVEAAYRLGLVRQRMGKDRAAMGAYRKVIKLRPGYAPARFMLAMAEERVGRRSRAIYDYAKAYKHMPELADPERNPLVLDSKLQTEAQLMHYRREVGANTFKVTPVDAAAVRLMMEARPAEAPPAPAATPGAPAPRAPLSRPPAPPAKAPAAVPSPTPPPARPGALTGPPAVIRQAAPATAVPVSPPGGPGPGIGGPARPAPTTTPTPES